MYSCKMEIRPLFDTPFLARLLLLTTAAMAKIGQTVKLRLLKTSIYDFAACQNSFTAAIINPRRMQREEKGLKKGAHCMLGQ